MKICVSSYSFSQLTKTGEYNLIDCIALAKEIGCEGIEFAGINPHDGSSKEEYAAKLGVQYGYNTLKYIKDFLDWQ